MLPTSRHRAFVDSSSDTDVALGVAFCPNVDLRAGVRNADPAVSGTTLDSRIESDSGVMQAANMGYSGFDSGAGQFSVSDNGAPEYVAGGPCATATSCSCRSVPVTASSAGLTFGPAVKVFEGHYFPTSPIRGLRRDADGQRFLSDRPGRPHCL